MQIIQLIHQVNQDLTLTINLLDYHRDNYLHNNPIKYLGDVTS